MSAMLGVAMLRPPRLLLILLAASACQTEGAIKDEDAKAKAKAEDARQAIDARRSADAAIHWGTIGHGNDDESAGYQHGPRVPAAQVRLKSERARSPHTEVIRRYLRRRLPRTRNCYRELLLERPRLRGQVMLTFRINESGIPLNLKAKARHAKLASCVENSTKDIVFRISSAPKTVKASFRYTFVPPKS